MPIPEIERVVEPCPKNRRRFPRILCRAQDDDCLRRSCLVARAPKKNGPCGHDPQNEHRYNHDRKDSANDFYSTFRLGSTLHP